MSTEPVSMSDLGVKHKYFEYHDMPARLLHPSEWPEVYRAHQGWQPVRDRFDFLHAYVPADETRIKNMIIDAESHPAPPRK